MFLLDNIFVKQYPANAKLSPIDNRNIQYKEIVSKIPVVKWEYKTLEQIRKFPIFNQGGAGSCVAHGIKKILGIENFLEEGKFVEFSARDIYSRGFLPECGMYARQGMSIGSGYGATLEQLMPSENLTEEQMRKAEDRTATTAKIAELYKGGAYVQLDPHNFDEIASVLARGKGVGMTCGYESRAWQKPQIGQVINPQYYHFIVATDFTMLNGQKNLVFENSWSESWGQKGRGFIAETEKTIIYEAWYFENMPNNWKEKKIEEDESKKPKYKFSTFMTLGVRSNEVKYLQDCLKYNGLFPNTIESTGYYGGVTYQSVSDFQKYNNLKINGVVDTPTREVLNSIFA